VRDQSAVRPRAGRCLKRIEDFDLTQPLGRQGGDLRDRQDETAQGKGVILFKKSLNMANDS
jgi:hypothetical protein